MKTYSPIDITFPCYVQPKLNGVNCTLGTDGLLRSRTGKYFPAVQAAFDWPKPAVELYGELYRHGWSLQRIIAATTPDAPTEDTKGLKLCVFEISGFDPYQVAMCTFDREFIFSTTSIKISTREQLDCEYNAILNSGHEGIVIRDLLGNVWKRKPYQDHEYTCIGVIEGKGKRAGHVGKFILALHDRGNNSRTFHCGGGQVNYHMLRHLYQHPPIGKKITVRYHSTSEDGIPLCAQFIAVRSYD